MARKVAQKVSLVIPIPAIKKNNDENGYQILKVIDKIALGGDTFLYVCVERTKNGKIAVDVRQWIESDTYVGPTRKGILFSKELLAKFLKEQTLYKAFEALVKAQNPDLEEKILKPTSKIIRKGKKK